MREREREKEKERRCTVETKILTMKMKMRMKMARAREEAEEHEVTESKDGEDAAEAKRARRSSAGPEEEEEEEQAIADTAPTAASGGLSDNEAYTVMHLVLPYVMSEHVDVVTNADIIARLRQPGQTAHIPARYANKVADALDMFENFPRALSKRDVDKLLGVVAMDTSALMPLYRIGVNSIKVEILEFFQKNPRKMETDHLPLLVTIATDRRHDSFVCDNVCSLLHALSASRTDLVTAAHLQLLAETIVREAGLPCEFGDNVQDFMGAKKQTGGVQPAGTNPTLVGLKQAKTMQLAAGEGAPGADVSEGRSGASEALVRGKIFEAISALLRANQDKLSVAERRGIVVQVLPIVLSPRAGCAPVRVHLCDPCGVIATLSDRVTDEEVQVRQIIRIFRLPHSGFSSYHYFEERALIYS